MVKNDVKGSICRFAAILILLALLCLSCVSAECGECDGSCNGDNCSRTQCLNDPKSCDDGSLSWKPYVTSANNSPPGRFESFNPIANISISGGKNATVSVNCDDGNSCTRDYYGQNGCVHDPLNCEDGNPCTTDYCGSNGCAHGPLICDDGNAVIADSSGACGCTNVPSSGDKENSSAFEPWVSGVSGTNIGYIEENVIRNESQSDRENVSTEIICDDGDPCTTDSYDGAACIYLPRNCDDANDSTIDSCEAGACVNEPIVIGPIVIDSGNNSTSKSLNQGILAGHRPKCDDNDSCTIDTFNGMSCVNTLKNCSDNNVTTFDYCYEGNCVHILTSCDDGKPCTTDSYNGTACVHPSKNCQDGNPCTVDYCDSVRGCRHTPVVCGPGKTCIDGFCLHLYDYYYAYPYTEPYNYNQPIKSYTIPAGTAITLPYGAALTALDTLKVENGVAYSTASPLRFVRDLGRNQPVSGYQSDYPISDQAEMIGLSWQTGPFTVVLIQPDGSVLPLKGDNQNVLHLTGSSYDYYFLHRPAKGNWNIEIRPTNPGTLGQGFSLITGPVRGAAPL